MPDVLIKGGWVADGTGSPGFLREAMDAGALGMSTGLGSNPGREATTAELVCLNAVAGEYDGDLHEPRPQPRRRHPRRDRRVPRGRPRGRSPGRDLALERATQHRRARRGWERAVETMAAAREAGMDGLADATPFREGLGQLSGILPRAGYAADVVVFDCDAPDDVSTKHDPRHYARGVEHVLVNGTVVVDGGEHAGARPGRHLLRS